MADSASVTVRGLSLVDKLMEDMEGRTKNLLPAWKVAGSAMERFVDDRFQSSTEPDGSPWAELSEATEKQRRGTTYKILVDTGALRNSVHADPYADKLRVGTNTVYGAVHQLGGEYVKARPFLPVERRAGRWVPVDRGPAVRLMDRIRKAIETYVATGKPRTR